MHAWGWQQLLNLSHVNLCTILHAATTFEIALHMSELHGKLQKKLPRNDNGLQLNSVGCFSAFEHGKIYI